MYQQITIVGYLGGDPEMRYTPSGVPVTNFNVATSRRWTNQDGTPGKETTWFRVTTWGKQAETCNQYLSKGRLVLVEGRVGGDRLSQEDGSTQIVPHAWVGQDGEPRAQFGITARVVSFLGERETAAPGGPAGEMEPEDIPF